MPKSIKYDATEVPEEYRAQYISQFHVEFLLGDPVVPTGDARRDAERAGKRKNHCIFRVTFAQPTSSGFKGAHISMDVVPDDTASDEAVYHGSNASDNAAIDGKMEVKLIPYNSQSFSAIKSFSFPIRRSNTSLGDVLDVALSRNMHLFQFAIIHGIAFMGCRDFM
jgi:hypothetical protein